eukprot:12398380-Karenia_brevis.AAC.1
MAVPQGTHVPTELSKRRGEFLDLLPWIEAQRILKSGSRNARKREVQTEGPRAKRLTGEGAHRKAIG